MATPAPTPAPPPAVVPVQPKPGHKTTEFVIVVLTDVGILAGALAGNLSPRYAAIATAIASGAYAIARGLAKLYPPKPTA
jgi:hypothetical protein